METKSATAGSGEPESNRFLIVDFTDDDIAYKSNSVQQNPDAQDYYLLQQHLHSEKLLFEDPDFPASIHTVLGHESTVKTNIQWVRPLEINPRPKFFVEEPSEFCVEKRSVLHGFLSAAMISLTTNDRAFRRTVPTDNSFDEERYTGMFHFRFWQYGRWVDVVIDDRLPTMDGKLIFIRPTQQNEFWFALLEKAYAKLRGSFGAIVSSTVTEAMQDFTGGITERYYLGDAVLVTDSSYETINRKLSKGSIMAAIKVRNYQGSEKQSQYTYSIMKTAIIESRLICLQTPLEELIEIYSLRNDGTADCFRKSWIRFDEFVRLYNRVEICNVLPDSMGNPSGDECSWQLSCIQGGWIAESTAGGPKDDANSFWKNPQYIVHLVQPDQVDSSGMCHLTISLIQKPRKGVNLPISFVVYRISENDFRSKPVPMTFSKKKEPTVVAYPTFSTVREVTSRVKTLPGVLLIVPCTQQRNLEGEFFLRIYSRPRRKTNENFKENTPSMNEKCWHSVVRMFYSLADTKASIDHTALASILIAHFFDMKSEFKQRKGPWKSLTRKRTPSAVVANPSTNDCHREVIEQLAQHLISRLELGPPERLNYAQFKRIVHDVQQWKEMFDLYDLDRTGHVKRKNLIKSLKSSLGEDNKQHTVSALLRVVEKSQVDKITFEEFVSFLLESQPLG
ncbi:calpain-A-like [Ochlerotatus camptorhynchus]|uniref:calpain-A-like n=1 Tax=Ochlerotatus camptorhynchus TaxID=644619 RepID=UPI0031DD16E4